VIGGETGGSEVLGDFSEEMEGRGGLGGVIGSREEGEFEGGGEGPVAIAGGSLQRAGAEFIKGVDGGGLLGDGVDGLVDQSKSEGGILIS
jgi:hypothetical protein